MKDVGSVTRVSPDRRVESLLKFRRRLRETPEVKKAVVTIIQGDCIFFHCIRERLKAKWPAGASSLPMSLSNARLVSSIPKRSPRTSSTCRKEWPIGATTFKVRKIVAKVSSRLLNFVFLWAGNAYCVSVQLKRWVVVYPGQMDRDVRSFVGMMQKVGGPHNFQVPQPIL